MNLMKMKKVLISNWIPALVMMGIIFWFSSQPSPDLLNFNWADRIVKKSGHVIGYAMLAFCYWYALGLRPKKRWVAWLFTFLYALTDEYHQSFVVGRHSSIWDVVVFDNLGALISLWLSNKYIKQKRPDHDARSLDDQGLIP